MLNFVFYVFFISVGFNKIFLPKLSGKNMQDFNKFSLSFWVLNTGLLKFILIIENNLYLELG